MSAPTSRSGRQLYDLLPELYRTRDNGDLAAYLDGFGDLLDRVRNTLEQRLADSFPDNPAKGLACQDWVLPYFAQLLDVRLVSPYVAGRRDEVAKAIAWRQRKGTLAAIESIASAILQVDAEVQEGWQRVATTPAVSLPQLPVAAFGAADLAVMTRSPRRLAVTREHRCSSPIKMAGNPGLPAVTVDLRHPSRAVQTSAGDPEVHATDFEGNLDIWPLDDPSAAGREGDPTSWKIANRGGAPCFPGSYEDASLRTADLRTPNWGQGHDHPKRILLFVPPPLGFFPPELQAFDWAAVAPAGQPQVIELVNQPDTARRCYRNLTNRSVEIIGPVRLGDAVTTQFEKLRFADEIRVIAGRLELRRVAALKVVVETTDIVEPVLNAVDCLFGSIEVPNGLARLEYVTVLGTAAAARLQASDCLFADAVTLDPPDAAAVPGSCIRYSRIPPSLAKLHPLTTTEAPVFCADTFGAPGGGVLHPAAPEAIRAGAEDGGEMGAYHAWRYAARDKAVMVKLQEFLPIGQVAVLIPDTRLLCRPPKVNSPNDDAPTGAGR